MAKKESSQEKETPSLTEWQKRNLEFLKKKEAEEAENEKTRQEALEQRRPKEETEEKNEESKSSDKDDVSEDKPTKEEKIQARLAKRLEKRERKRQKEAASRIPIKEKRLAGIVLSFFSICILLSIFLLSPLSKDKNITVSGLVNAQETDILSASAIQESDYITTVLWNSSTIEKKIEADNTWVKDARISYGFPNNLNIAITEYQIVAYKQTDNGYNPILENGKVDGLVSADNLPENFITVNIDNKDYLKTFVKKIAKMSKELTSEIKVVSLTATDATPDLLSLEMQDGNTVRVPLSDLETKLPYYDKIKTKLDGTAIVDMEVGIYTTTSDLESSAASAESSSSEADAAASDNSDSSEAGSVTESSQTVDTETTTENLTESASE
ncbi:cell division protein FtsQ/DivIB [Streptococcus dentiloxodontae]